jgi:hypothetical protein
LLKLKNIRRKKALRFRRRACLISIKYQTSKLLARRLQTSLFKKLPRRLHNKEAVHSLRSSQFTTLPVSCIPLAATIGAVRYFSRGGKPLKKRYRRRRRNFKKNFTFLVKKPNKRTLGKRFLRRRR